MDGSLSLSLSLSLFLPSTHIELTEPEAVRNLTVSGITTSSVFVSWTKPVGISGSYRVEWTNGSVSERTATQHTHVNITDLTPGGHYTFSVKTLTCNQTEGNTVSESFYTSKYLIYEIIGGTYLASLCTNRSVKTIALSLPLHLVSHGIF